MTDCRSFPTRRGVLTGLAAGVMNASIRRPAAAQERHILALSATPGLASLRRGEKDTSVWSLVAVPVANLRFRRGDEVEVTLNNDLPVPVAVNWHGIDGVPAIEPLTVRAPVSPGRKDTFVMPLRHAGTMLCDVRLLGDGQGLPSRALPLVVEERETVTVDRDEVLLIEDWRLRADGTAIAPGTDAKDGATVYTVNGTTTTDIAVRAYERLRLRFINACQRNVIGIKIENHDVRVMAIDSQPSEPFLARGGELVLAPGGRIDVFLDAARAPGSASQIHLHDGKDIRPIARLVYTAEPPVRGAFLPAAPPLPSNGLPSRLDLKSALRVDLALNTSSGPADWIAPANFTAALAPAFQVKRGRTVVLALTNRAEIPSVFHLHGHHFRLLDRLDDGWKPFWLDTLAVDPGQTQRIALAAEHAGRWLMESVATDWTAPRLVRWYGVE
jgi:FtsP/CotA-like multicopper oxidase with cupredoxin domain